MDTNEALFGVLYGNIRDIITKFSVDLPKKRRYGGASAIRFARIRKEKRRNYVRIISEMTTQCFISNVETLIIWENFDLIRYVLRNTQTEEMNIIYLRIDEKNDVQLEQVEQMRLVDWFANNYKKFGRRK
jgi:peptide subunit release factor 1 (eRF1)